ncbi:helix-turn-helix transcriptional regulator [Staphylococcus nepalensis]|uniref:helix-turn-helix transcriptional regulator n=1 Tax=Staphylococcus nepalensis TaxID=214473 RepID=UPI003CF80A8F
MRLFSKTNNIKELLVLNGKNVSSLSNDINYNRSYLNQVVVGKKSPSPKLAKQIADYFGKDIEDLFTIESLVLDEANHQVIEKLEV